MKAAVAFGLTTLVAVAGTSHAAPAASHIQVSGAWSRPEPAGLSTGVVYLTVTDTGERPDRLLGATSPVAARLGLHRSKMAGGMMSMAPVAGGLDLPPGQKVRLAPGGYHFMLEGLKRPLVAGRSFPVMLRFAHAAPLTVDVVVRADTPPS